MGETDLDKQIRNLVFNFSRVLNSHKGHLQSFCDHGVQVEGWFKGELLGFLEQQRTNGVIAGFAREEKVRDDKRKKVDFKLVLPTGADTELAWIELKHWLIGRQKGVTYGASFYFSDPTSVGISQDARKLAKVPEAGYILVLATANPGDEEWQKGIAKFNGKFAPLSLETLTQPSYFPSHYCLGLLKIVGQ